MPESTTTTATANRRAAVGGDRRKRSRSGRRASDPHTNWRHLAWLFAAYATYLSIRSLPATMKKLPETIKAVPDTIRKIFRRGPIEPA